MVFELYFPSTSSDHLFVLIDLSATSDIKTIFWVSINNSADHNRPLVHMLEYNNVTPNYLIIDLVLKNKSGVAYAQYLVVRIILYGILGYRNDFPSSVGDRKFEITDDTHNFLTVGRLK